jgi:lysine 2,3-aminomutase
MNSYSNIPPEKWNDWKWQFANRIDNVEKLSKVIPLGEQEKVDITNCLNKFRMSITPYYASLIDPNDPNDPIKMQSVPSIAELYDNENDMEDPLNEEGDSPVPNIVHRYPDRVLFLITLRCSMYCRHCTRRRVVGEKDGIITENELKVALNYIKKHTEIRDVLISGGDPFILGTSKLEHIISSIREISHVDVIRIGTRVPVVMPMRITDELMDMLKKYQPIWINTHFNHIKELTPEAEAACQKIVNAGIPLGNQNVLLKGINDSTQAIKPLMLKLVHNRVRPYYMYQCDLSKGIGHFRTNVETGVKIIHELTGFISGYAVPKFVIDAPAGGGKIPINYNYVISKDDKEVVMENYMGKTFYYPQPQK